MTPEDLKNYGKRESAFQLISEEAAGILFGVIAAFLFITDLLERMGVLHIWR